MNSTGHQTRRNSDSPSKTTTGPGKGTGQTTMPPGRRSAMRTYMSGSDCAAGPSDRSPLTSVCATATARSLDRQC